VPALTAPQALARLRELRPGPPGVFVTGHAGADAEAEITAPGRRVLAKPFARAELARALREAAAAALLAC